MKRRIILFIICLLTANICFSQTTSKGVVITPEQLQQINLIFNEHDKLLKTDSLLRIQINDYKNLLSYSDSIDSLKTKQINSCMSKIQEDSVVINNLETKITKISKWSKIQTWIIGGLGVIAIVLGVCR